MNNNMQSVINGILGGDFESGSPLKKIQERLRKAVKSGDENEIRKALNEAPNIYYPSSGSPPLAPITPHSEREPFSEGRGRTTYRQQKLANLAMKIDKLNPPSPTDPSAAGLPVVLAGASKLAKSEDPQTSSLLSRLLSTMNTKVASQVGSPRHHQEDDRDAKDYVWNEDKQYYEKKRKGFLSRFLSGFSGGQDLEKEVVGDPNKFHHYTDISRVAERLQTIGSRGQGITSEMTKATGKLGSLAITGARAAAGDPAAMIQVTGEVAELLQEHIQKIKEGYKKTATELGQMATSQKLEDMGLHSLEAYKAYMGSTARNIGGPIIGDVLASVTDSFNDMLLVLPNALKSVRDWTEGLHKANIQFAEFSGGMSGVKARQEVRDIYLSMERGERRAPTAEILARNMHGLNRTIAPIEDLLSSIFNLMAARLARGFDRLLSNVSTTSEALLKILNMMENKETGPAQDWMAAAEWTAQGWIINGRPNRFGNNSGRNPGGRP